MVNMVTNAIGFEVIIVQLEILFRILALNIKMQLSLHFCDLFSVAIIRVLIVKLWILLTFSVFIIFLLLFFPVYINYLLLFLLRQH